MRPCYHIGRLQNVPTCSFRVGTSRTHKNGEMKFRVKPGKVTCAGLVAILLVLPAGLWKRASADPDIRVVVKPASRKVG